MDEEIKNEILKALQEMRAGAPEAWQYLCEEVVQRGIFMMAFGAIILVLSAFSAWLSYKLYKANNSEASGFTGAISVVTGFIGLAFISINGYHIAAPSLALLGR